MIFLRADALDSHRSKTRLSNNNACNAAIAPSLFNCMYDDRGELRLAAMNRPRVMRTLVKDPKQLYPASSCVGSSAARWFIRQDTRAGEDSESP